MRITNTHKFFDTLLLSLLVMSGGGLLFVFQRNNLSFLLLFLAIFVLVFMGKKSQSINLELCHHILNIFNQRLLKKIN